MGCVIFTNLCEYNTDRFGKTQLTVKTYNLVSRSRRVWAFSPFADDGMVVFYKGNGERVILASPSGRSHLTSTLHVIQDFFEAVFYTLINLSFIFNSFII